MSVIYMRSIEYNLNMAKCQLFTFTSHDIKCVFINSQRCL